MKYFTQSNLRPGNCWQTAIACLLDVDPDLLPPQVEIESMGPCGVLSGWGSYTNVLNGYLGKHHGLIYSEVQAYKFGSVKPVNAGHVMCGPTVRTEALRVAGAPHVHHCVVAVDGKMIWDVHPSRVGLTEVKTWGVLGAIQEVTVNDRKRMANDVMYDLIFNQCVCPQCSLEKVLEMNRVFMEEKKNSEALVGKE